MTVCRREGAIGASRGRAFHAKPIPSGDLEADRGEREVEDELRERAGTR